MSAIMNVTMTGMQLVKGVIKQIAEEVEFTDAVSEDYKKGFNDYGTVLLAALERMEREANDR